MILADPSARAALREIAARDGGWSDGRGPAADFAADLLETIDDVRFPGAIIPRHNGTGFSYYLVADSEVQWRSLSPLATAFIGRTLSTFDGRADVPDLADTFETALLSAGVQVLARVTAGSTSAADRRRLAASMARMRSLASAAPARPDVRLRTTSSVLAEFRMAIAARDRAVGLECIAALQNDLRLDAINQLFMQIEVEASVGDWPSLWSAQIYREACRAYRPPLVTLAVVRTAYYAQVEPSLRQLTAIEAVALFSETAAPRTEGLYQSEPPNDLPEVGLVFLMAAAAGCPVAPSTLRRIQASSDDWPTWEREKALELVRILPDNARQDLTLATVLTPEETVLQVLERGDLDLTRPESIRQAVLAAASIGTTSAAHAVLASVVGVASNVLDAALKPLFVGQAWRQLQSTSDARVPPGSWAEWLERLSEAGPGDAVRWAASAAAERPIESEFRSDDELLAFVHDLDAVAAESGGNLHAALPILVSWATSGSRWPDPSLAPLYRELLLILLLGDIKSPAYVGACTQLIAGLLELGLGRDEYTAVLTDVAEWIPANPGTQGADTLLDLVDVTLTWSCPDPGARLMLWHRTVDSLRPLHGRLTPVQRSLVLNLSSALTDELGLQLLEGLAADAVAPPPDYGGITVALYTLVDSAGRRLKQVLESSYPGLRVDVNSDHVATPTLRQLARQADLFVISWTRATHAATDFIRSERPDNMPIIYAGGSGSSSIAREIADRLQGIAAVTP